MSFPYYVEFFYPLSALRLCMHANTAVGLRYAISVLFGIQRRPTCCHIVFLCVRRSGCDVCIDFLIKRCLFVFHQLLVEWIMTY